MPDPLRQSHKGISVPCQVRLLARRVVAPLGGGTPCNSVGAGCTGTPLDIGCPPCPPDGGACRSDGAAAGPPAHREGIPCRPSRAARCGPFCSRSPSVVGSSPSRPFARPRSVSGGRTASESPSSSLGWDLSKGQGDTSVGQPCEGSSRSYSDPFIQGGMLHGGRTERIYGVLPSYHTFTIRDPCIKSLPPGVAKKREPWRYTMKVLAMVVVGQSATHQGSPWEGQALRAPVGPHPLHPWGHGRTGIYVPSVRQPSSRSGLAV